MLYSRVKCFARARRRRMDKGSGMIIDCVTNWRIYSKAPAWHCAFEYLEALSADTEECDRVSLDGGKIYACVMSHETRGPEGSVLEAHDIFIDIQMCLTKGERILWYPRAQLEIKTPYDAEGDALFFHPPAFPPIPVDNLPGRFTTLFPGDAHMPMQMIDGRPELVKKVVVKLRADLLTGY